MGESRRHRGERPSRRSPRPPETKHSRPRRPSPRAPLVVTPLPNRPSRRFDGLASQRNVWLRSPPVTEGATLMTYIKRRGAIFVTAITLATSVLSFAGGILAFETARENLLAASSQIQALQDAPRLRKHEFETARAEEQAARARERTALIQERTARIQERKARIEERTAWIKQPRARSR
jgi:hypothetical protein